MKKDGIVVEGHRGSWYVLETKEVHGFDLSLLEHEQFGEDATALLVGEGKDGLVVLAETMKGWQDVPDKFTLMKAVVDVLPHYTSVGGYPLIYVTYGGDILCADCAGEAPESIKVYRTLYEGARLACEGWCGTFIESAYGDPEEDEEEANA